MYSLVISLADIFQHSLSHMVCVYKAIFYEFWNIFVLEVYKSCCKSVLMLLYVCSQLLRVDGAKCRILKRCSHSVNPTTLPLPPLSIQIKLYLPLLKEPWHDIYKVSKRKVYDCSFREHEDIIFQIFVTLFYSLDLQTFSKNIFHQLGKTLQLFTVKFLNFDLNNRL